MERHRCATAAALVLLLLATTSLSASVSATRMSTGASSVDVTADVVFKCPPQLTQAKCGKCKKTVTGKVYCVACIAGYVLNRGNCLACPVGQFASAGATACTPCPKGTYAASPGTATCSKCPNGTTTAGPNSTSKLDCKVCLPGWYGVAELCKLCPVGKYCLGNKVASLAKALACPQGWTTSGAGAKAKAECNKDIDGCALKPCSTIQHATGCLDVTAPGVGFTCSCEEGFQWDPTPPRSCKQPPGCLDKPTLPPLGSSATCPDLPVGVFWYPLGTECTIDCINGYLPNGLAVCVDGNPDYWEIPQCLPAGCPKPVPPVHGVDVQCPVVPGPVLWPPGIKCDVVCEKLYVPDGQATCQPDTTWDMPACKPQGCPEPDPLPDHAIQMKCPSDARLPYPNGTECSLVCQEGFESAGLAICMAPFWSMPACIPKHCPMDNNNCPQTLCTGNITKREGYCCSRGTESIANALTCPAGMGPDGFCNDINACFCCIPLAGLRPCSEPAPKPEHAVGFSCPESTTDPPTYAVGTVCNVLCELGFEPTATATCLLDRTWSLPVCKPLAGCPKPPLPTHAIDVQCPPGTGPPYPGGTECTVVCEEGFDPAGPEICNKELLVWSVPECVPKLCPLNATFSAFPCPQQPCRGEVTQREGSCCSNLPLWNNTIPIYRICPGGTFPDGLCPTSEGGCFCCVSVHGLLRCSEPAPKPLHAVDFVCPPSTTDPPSYAVGTVCSMACESGYEPTGPATCLLDKTWDLGVCKPKSGCPMPPVLPDGALRLTCSGAVGPPYEAGTECEVACAAGYQAAEKAVCSANLDWTIPPCIGLQCPESNIDGAVSSQQLACTGSRTKLPGTCTSGKPWTVDDTASRCPAGTLADGYCNNRAGCFCCVSTPIAASCACSSSEAELASAPMNMPLQCSAADGQSVANYTEFDVITLPDAQPTGLAFETPDSLTDAAFDSAGCSPLPAVIGRAGVNPSGLAVPVCAQSVKISFRLTYASRNSSIDAWLVNSKGRFLLGSEVQVKAATVCASPDKARGQLLEFTVPLAQLAPAGGPNIIELKPHAVWPPPLFGTPWGFGYDCHWGWVEIDKGVRVWRFHCHVNVYIIRIIVTYDT